MSRAASAWQPKTEKFQAYAEWHMGQDLVVDGQRVTSDQRTKFKGEGVTCPEDPGPRHASLREPVGNPPPCGRHEGLERDGDG